MAGLHPQAPQPALRQVQRDAGDPGGDRRDRLAALGALPRPGQGLGDRVLGGRLAAGHERHGRDHARVVGGEEGADLDLAQTGRSLHHDARDLHVAPMTHGSASRLTRSPRVRG